MRIEELLDKRERIIVQMLHSLIMNEGTISMTLLKKELGLSKSGFDHYLEDLMDCLHSFDKESTLIVEDSHIQLVLSHDVSRETILSQLIVDSVKFQLLEFLLLHRKFNTVQLVNELMISESSVFRKIKEINMVLQEFNIQIKNGQLQGEELQIRYFYFQLYSFLFPMIQTAFSVHCTDNQTFISALEKATSSDFSKFSIEKINLWINITKKRLMVQKPLYKNLKKHMLPFLDDSMYLQVDKLMTLYYSRTSAEVNKQESMLFFVFLVSFTVFSQERFYDYDLIRSKKLPTPVLDIYIRETILVHYAPSRLSIEKEKEVGFQLSQINSQLYFLKGKLEVYDRDNMLNRKKLLLGDSLTLLLDRLLKVALAQVKQVYSSENSLHDYTLINYASVLTMIDFLMVKPLKVAIDFDRLEIYREPFKQLLLIEFRSFIGVHLESYQEGYSYDLVITSLQSVTSYQYDPIIYRLSDFHTNYDMQQIKQLLNDLRIQNN